MLARFALASLLIAGAASAAPVIYYTNLSGLNENPANSSTATGYATISIDTATHLLTVSLTFNGLTGGIASAGHIHCCIASPGNVGVAVEFTGLPATSSGSYSPSAFNLANSAVFNNAFRTANGGTAASAEAALAAGVASGLAYVNIHNATFPGGEIRGFLVAAPEPATWGLTAGAFAAAAFFLRKRKS